MTSASEPFADELLRMQEKLRSVPDPLAMLQGILAFAPFGLQIYCVSGKSLLVNRAFREMFGSEPPPDYSIFQDEIAARAGVTPLVHRAFAGEAVHIPAMWYDPRNLEHVVVEEGRQVAFEAWMLPLFGREGEVTHVALVIKDITKEMLARELADREAEARRAAERARERVMRIQLVTSGLASAAVPREVARVLLEQGVSALGATYAVVAAVAADGVAEILGWEGSTRTGEGPPRSFPLDESTPLAEAIRTDAPVFDDSAAAIPLSSRGSAIGAVLFEFSSPRTFDVDDRAFALGLAWQGAQALERARLFREVQEAAKRAEEASRAKDEFLSVLSHELRTPLNAIQGWAHLIATTRSRDPSVVDRGVEVIQRNVRAQVTLVDDMLDVAGIIRGKLRLSLKRIELASIVDAAVESVRPSASVKGVAIDVDVPGRVTVMVDLDRMQQVVWNLLSNAIKFTARGGRVTIRTATSDDAVRLSVSDTGQGLAPGDIPYVFDRFRQVDSSTTRAKGGLGLGLAIVRHLVEAHGGQVRAESAGLGKGATFEVELPTSVPFEEPSPPSSARISVAEAPAPPASSRQTLAGTRVLVVDDEPDAVELLTFVLEGTGAEVRTATSTRGAMDLLATFTPDVLVSDIGMPEEDGFALIRRIRGLDSEIKNVPAIALTAYARREDVEAVHNAGFSWHVAKPVEPRRLVGVVAEAARARRPT